MKILLSVLNRLVILLLLAMTTCRKDNSDVVTGTPYMLNLSGTKTYYLYDSVAVLDVSLILDVFYQDSVAFLEGILFYRNQDSVYGDIIIPDEDYLINPFAMGNLSRNQEKIWIEGQYAAVKDSVTPIHGTFMIYPAW